MNCIVEAWQQYEGELRGFIRQQVGDAAVAEDLLQDVFVRAVAQGSRFCALENVRAWLFRVTRNRIVDWRRSRRAHEPVPEQLPQPEAFEEPVVSLSQCLPVALERLSAADRDIIRHCDLDGLAQAEYAARHGLGLPATKSRIQRARRRLKAALDEACHVRLDEQGRVCCFDCSR